MNLDAAMDEVKVYYKWHRATRRLKNGELETLDVLAQNKVDADFEAHEKSPHDDDTPFDIEEIPQAEIIIVDEFESRQDAQDHINSLMADANED